MDAHVTPVEESIGDRRLTHWHTRFGKALARTVTKRVPWVSENALIIAGGLLGSAVMGVATKVAAEIYEAVHEKDGVSLLDQPILDAMIARRQPWLNTTVTAFTTIGGPVASPIIATSSVLYLAYRWKSRTPIVLMAAATAGSIAMTVAGKKHIERVRPAHHLAVKPYELSPSFPSGHSLNSVVVGGVVAYLLLCQVDRKRIRTMIVVTTVGYAGTMGASRVYLGHHWFTDVLVGWVMGSGWLTGIITIHRLALTVRRRRRLALLAAGIKVPRSAFG